MDLTPTLDLADLGLPAVVDAELSAEQTARIAATLDAADGPTVGEPLPLLWHWGHFAPANPTRHLGRDGHPRVGGHVLDAYPRRMWAASEIKAPGHLVVGTPASRISVIVDTKEVRGRSGDLLVVRLRHRYVQLGVDQLVEDQTLIYRGAGEPLPLPLGDVRPAPTPGAWIDRHTPSSELLFRYSAVTFNSHRIHYDHEYATGVEGYPARVVHGQLTATLAAASLRRHLGRPLRRFAFRATAPLFVDQPMTIVGRREPEPHASVIRNDGTEAMSITAG